MKRRGTSNAITAPLKTREASPIGTSIVSLCAVQHESTTNNMSPEPDHILQAKAPSHDQIAERAKAIWLAGGCLLGQDQEHWYTAEAQLRTEVGMQ